MIIDPNIQSDNNAQQLPPDKNDRDTKPVQDVINDRIKHVDDAELLTEQSLGSAAKSRFLRAIKLILIFILVLAIFAAIGSYVLGTPLLVKALPELISEPSSHYSAYNRLVKGYIDYFPTVTRSKTSRISDLGVGSSFAFVSSAHVVPDAGVEGVLRMEIDNPLQQVENPDVDVDYQLVLSDNSEGAQAYMLFNKWPASFEGIIPISLVKENSWLVYDSERSAFNHPAMASLFWFFTPRSDSTKSAVSKIWEYALESRFISWKIDKLYRKAAEGNRVTDISFTVQQKNIQKFLDLVREDAEYETELKKVFETQFEQLNLVQSIGSLRNASGSVTIDVSTRIIQTANVQFDMYNEQVGTIRGYFQTVVTPLSSPITIVSPETAIDFSELLAVPALLEVVPTAADENVVYDADNDGLSDSDEVNVYKTDPRIPDTDNDGFLDGEEVESGFNPNGEGELQ